jgi:hypothetical protein
MLTAEARVRTDHPGRYLVQLGRHARQVHRLRHDRDDAQPPPAVAHVEWSQTSGVVDFGRGRCTMRVSGNLLTLRAEAADEASLQLVQDLVTRNIERFGRRDHLRVSWQRLSPPVSPAPPAS